MAGSNAPGAFLVLSKLNQTLTHIFGLAGPSRRLSRDRARGGLRGL